MQKMVREGVRACWKDRWGIDDGEGKKVGRRDVKMYVGIWTEEGMMDRECVGLVLLGVQVEFLA